MALSAAVLLALCVVCPIVLYLIWTSITSCCSSPPAADDEQKRGKKDKNAAPSGERGISTAAGSELGVGGDVENGRLRPGLASSRPRFGTNATDAPYSGVAYSGNLAAVTQARAAEKQIQAAKAREENALESARAAGGGGGRCGGRRRPPHGAPHGHRSHAGGLEGGEEGAGLRGVGGSDTYTANPIYSGGSGGSGGGSLAGVHSEGSLSGQGHGTSNPAYVGGLHSGGLASSSSSRQGNGNAAYSGAGGSGGPSSSRQGNGASNPAYAGGQHPGGVAPSSGGLNPGGLASSGSSFPGNGKFTNKPAYLAWKLEENPIKNTKYSGAKKEPVSRFRLFS